MPPDAFGGPCDGQNYDQFGGTSIEQIHRNDQCGSDASLLPANGRIKTQIPNFTAGGSRCAHGWSSPSGRARSQSSLSWSSFFHALGSLFKAAKSAFAARKNRSRR